MTEIAPSGSALQNRLKEKGLLPSTRAKYQEIIDSAGDEDLVTWIHSKLRSGTPIGTVLPMRAAVKHYLVAEQGYSEEEVAELLPSAQGKNTDLRDPLSAEQLALYHSAVDEVSQEPARTILKLLPMTGLRIGEICALVVSDVPRDDSDFLSFHAPSGQKRVVPLVGSAKEILTEQGKEKGSEDWLFPGYQGGPITAHAVRKYTRTLAQRHPDLEGLTPSTLRHTFAVLSLRRGTSLEELKEILGHGSITTTKRYLKR